MCLDLDAVEEVEKIGLPVDEHVCRSKKGECPFAGICGHQRQKGGGGRRVDRRPRDAVQREARRRWAIWRR